MEVCVECVFRETVAHGEYTHHIVAAVITGHGALCESHNAGNNKNYGQFFHHNVDWKC